MKTHILGASCAVLIGITSTVQAGGLVEPVMETPPSVVIAETTPSGSLSGEILIPLILVALIAAAMSSSSGGAEEVFRISDARLKTDIHPVGHAANGLPLYHYRYIGDSTVYEGVMAQDVLSHTPEAVQVGPRGIMAVNYDMLGLTLNVVD
ncbi:tail fiber domain-containing protein [Pseudooctadecabacter jejudonensis]|uniref:Peptidase S74 domain-containing protein n=1 Tax=Pseudooctadecabacter jejudonensis TaxID=1391910 RepID=A0A1Y5RCQ9_9RHOB|nr:tail fiber domain-containing protein [Pseudooctadecabacter jejudonensis]SLN11661.1 hypothetical protein PSJ8397_00097 [Pseudooctadecabacter jejudonensis]